MKNGRKALAEREKPVLNPRLNDRLFVPEEVKKKAREAGYEVKWIDAKRLADNHGFHPSEWEPAKKDEFGKLSNIQFGSAPDGLEHRGTMIFAKRPIAVGDMYRAQIKEKNRVLNQVSKKHKQELREFARQNGVQTVIESDE